MYIVRNRTAKNGLAAIENNLAALRQRRGLSASSLARIVGTSRQSIYAMEAGNYLPNTAVALRLAQVLDVSVEELFTLPGTRQFERTRPEHAVILPESSAPRPGQPVQLCRVGKLLFASTPPPIPWYLPPSDAIIAGTVSDGRRANVRAYQPETGFRNRILVAGCDPAISILARHVQLAGVELVIAHRNSSQALSLLKQRCIHVAGTHLRDESSGGSNIAVITRMFSTNSVAVISFAVWDEGLLTASGNPKGIRGVEDLARKDVAIVNREPGAGSRALLDSQLARAGIGAKRVRGYNGLASGHLPAAWQVQAGMVDCCVATRAAARAFGLGFISLASERYDLAIRRSHLDMPQIPVLLDTLSRAGFRRELEGTGGYDMRTAGTRML